MKKVFTNAMTAHVWAQQSQSEGRSPNGNLFFKDQTIYSYGYHFPIATFISADVVLMNNANYSVSTSKHQSDMLGALSSDITVISTSREIMEHAINHYPKGPKFKPSMVEQWHIGKAEEYIELASKRRKLLLAEYDLNSALGYIENCLKILKLWKHKPSAKLLKLRDELESDRLGLTERTKVVLAAQKVEFAKKLKAQKAEVQDQLDQEIKEWYLRERHRFSWGVDQFVTDTLLRLNGDIIETSKGAQFPVEHGIKAYKFIKRMKLSKTSYHCDNMFQAMKLGPFKISKVSSAGHVTAACHYVKWDQIERIAKELGL